MFQRKEWTNFLPLMKFNTGAFHRLYSKKIHFTIFTQFNCLYCIRKKNCAPYIIEIQGVHITRVKKGAININSQNKVYDILFIILKKIAMNEIFKKYKFYSVVKTTSQN